MLDACASVKGKRVTSALDFSDRLSSRMKMTYNKAPTTQLMAMYDAMIGCKRPPIGGPIRIPIEKDARIRPKQAAL